MSIFSTICDKLKWFVRKNLKKNHFQFHTFDLVVYLDLVRKMEHEYQIQMALLFLSLIQIVPNDNHDQRYKLCTYYLLQIKLANLINFTLITCLILQDFLIRCKFAKQLRLLIAMFVNVWHLENL